MCGAGGVVGAQISTTIWLLWRQGAYVYHMCKLHKIKREHFYDAWHDGGSKGCFGLQRTNSNGLNEQTWLMDLRVQRTVSGLLDAETLQSPTQDQLLSVSFCSPGGFFPRLATLLLSNDCHCWLQPQTSPCLLVQEEGQSDFLEARKFLYPNPQQASLSGHLTGPKWLKSARHWTIPGRRLGDVIGLCQLFLNFLALGPFYTFKNFGGPQRAFVLVNYIHQNHTWELLG